MGPHGALTVIGSGVSIAGASMTKTAAGQEHLVALETHPNQKESRRAAEPGWHITNEAGAF